MRCDIDDDLSHFGSRVIPWLQQDPVVHNVLCTVIEARMSGRMPVEDEALWLRVLDADGVVRAVAVRTPPHPLLVSMLSPAAAEELATVVAERCAPASLPGAQGPVPAAQTFADAWTAATGAKATRGMVQRMYRLDQVIPPPRVPGRLRQASDTDAGVVAQWLEGFARDTGTPMDAKPAVSAGRMIGAGELWLWEAASRPVAMAAARTPVARVSRISAVYTPPELRGRGFAAACVATLSQRVLDHGAKACMLYADLANPASNSIYLKVGYYPVTDAEMWQFTSPN